MNELDYYKKINKEFIELYRDSISRLELAINYWNERIDALVETNNIMAKRVGAMTDTIDSLFERVDLLEAKVDEASKIE
ncbi:MAG: hypothetical protein JRN37_06570 [Nitrososphaerota archaeon]|jgi:hypothetical protein|nr:hypothetical protein [Nitrososphaerota archaeon]MDG7038800.1 hypothetical protein [Nitrososphaerota archaeon]